MIFLIGCFPWTGTPDSIACDARTLAPGEVRARRLPCTDEIGDGSEARAGDWVLENAVARFFVRSTDGPLTELEGDGGTLIDAYLVGEDDLLLELIPEVDRSSIEAVDQDGFAELVMPGMTYRLDADSDVLQLDADVTMKPYPGDDRVGATFRDHGSFLAVDGEVEELGGQVHVTGVTRLALSPESHWPDGEAVHAFVDGARVAVSVDGAQVDQLWVDDGFIDGWAPPGATFLAQQDGCIGVELFTLRCGQLDVRVEDGESNQLRAEVTDGSWEDDLPVGGWSLPVTPTERPLWVWAGPAYAAWQVDWPREDTADAVLRKRIDTDGVALMAPAVQIGPDPDEDADAATMARTLVGEGVDYAVMVADDEVPDAGSYGHDPVLTVAASRAAGMVWSWPWDPSSKRRAHGAVPWQGLTALDMLAMSEGGQGLGRITVVTTAWVTQALREAEPSTWDPRPDAVWLDSLDDLPVLLDLYTRWVDVAPLGPRTWVGYTGARNATAIDAGIVRGETSAGTGPRILLARLPVSPDRVRVEVQAPGWMDLREVTVWTQHGGAPIALDADGVAWVGVGDADWMVVSVAGDKSRPWGDAPSWGVSAPLWLRSPISR